MKSILKKIDAFSDAVGKTFSWIIIVLILLVVMEVILRRLFNSPTTWSFEVTIQLYALHFMIVAGYALLHRSHVTIDILYEKFNKRTQAIIDVVSYLIFFFPFMLVVLYQGTKYAKESWLIRETSWSVFAPPLYPIKSVIPIMALLLLIQGLSVLIRQFYFALTGREL